MNYYLFVSQWSCFAIHHTSKSCQDFHFWLNFPLSVSHFHGNRSVFSVLFSLCTPSSSLYRPALILPPCLLLHHSLCHSFPFSSCHICSILRFPLYFLASPVHASSPSLSFFFVLFFSSSVTFTAPFHSLFVTRWCICPAYSGLTFYSSFVLSFFFYSWQCSVAACAAFKDEHTHGTFILTFVQMHFWTSACITQLTPFPRWETVNR